MVALLLLLPDLRASHCDDQSDDHGFEGGEGYGDCLRLGHVDCEQHTIIIIVVNHSGRSEQLRQRLPAFRTHSRLRYCLAVGLEANYLVFWRLMSVLLKKSQREVLTIFVFLRYVRINVASLAVYFLC